jgi:hypothetical protein
VEVVEDLQTILLSLIITCDISTVSFPAREINTVCMAGADDGETRDWQHER